jgi:hypothetical protein
MFEMVHYVQIAPLFAVKVPKSQITIHKYLMEIHNEWPL